MAARPCVKSKSDGPSTFQSDPTPAAGHRQQSPAPPHRRNVGINGSQVLFDFSRFSTLKSQKALTKASEFQLESDGLIADHPHLGGLFQRAGAAGDAGRRRSRRNRTEEAVRLRLQAPGSRAGPDHRHARSARPVRRRPRQHDPGPQCRAGRLPGAGRDHRRAGRQPEGPAGRLPAGPAGIARCRRLGQDRHCAEPCVAGEAGAGAVRRDRRRHRTRRPLADPVPVRRLQQGRQLGRPHLQRWRMSPTPARPAARAVARTWA